ncbi:hypothetical protein [Petrotoga sp. 9PWA.NaAc.5.4]|uniref:hypothetical protein n=1 Tax=Petrotoga sp. 9PWA.NaAc.5.4 TaxID=1434328 RepID=UPI000CC3B509|nr:hypothetical protein [Petrotoga sp. 9PWA.NaAc.5.4]PNR93706.1 hypothetical protein X924_07715 [Petrotoga sp. 9PWA.NaAc.5.4]
MLDDENIRLTIKGIKNETKDIPHDKYKNFEEMVKDYIEKTQGVLTNIKINEKEVPLNYYNEIKDAFFEGGEEVELEFSSKKKVLNELISQSYEYIEKVKENLEKVSKEVLLNTDEGHKMLMSIAEGIEAMLDVIEQTKNFTGEKFYEPEELKNVQNIVVSIINAQNNNDYLELSDIMEFNFQEVLDVFTELLNKAEKVLRDF